MQWKTLIIWNWFSRTRFAMPEQRLVRALMALALGAEALAAQAFTATQWKVRYFYDENDSAINFVDVSAPAAGAAMAWGALTENGNRPRGVMVATRDAGKTWQLTKLPEVPLSGFFLDANQGWMVARDAVYATLDGGAVWKRRAKLRDVLRVQFVSPTKGFAVGMQKSAWSSDDGGVTWRKIAEAQAPTAKPETSAYTTIAFLGERQGVITGLSRPPRRGTSPLPLWMDPDAAKPTVPNLMLTLETLDGGATWRSQTTSVFGQVTRVALGRIGLALIEFGPSFEYPSEIINLTDSKSAMRGKDRAIKDIAVDGNYRLWAAGIEVTGKLHELPIPSRVQTWQSIDGQNWFPMAVDYRAVANRLRMAFSGTEGWIVTDGGMILRLE